MVRKLMLMIAVAMMIGLGTNSPSADAGYYRFNVRGPAYGRVTVRGAAANWNRGYVRVTPRHSRAYVGGGFYTPRRVWYGW